MIIAKLHYISQGASPKLHLENIQKACAAGAELVQLRLQHLSDKKFLKLAKEAREITAHFQTRLLITDNYKIAKEVKADGVHIEDIAFFPNNIRTELYPWQMLGANANNLQDCETLITKEVDYISLGPLRTTGSNEALTPELGLKGFTAIAEVLNTDTPIIGFGGITTEDVTAILETGISGITVSCAITRDFNSIRTFNQLLNASLIDEQRHSFK
jgi:thiamine-phosphate pyrophosphorylase